MPEPTFDLAAAHRWFAVEANNAAWALVGRDDRSSDEAWLASGTVDPSSTAAAHTATAAITLFVKAFGILVPTNGALHSTGLGRQGEMGLDWPRIGP